MVRGRRKWPWIVALAFVLAVVTVVVARNALLRDRARTVSASQALDRFRAVSATTNTTAPAVATSTTVMPVRTLPPLGVYRYTTTGEESVDVLGGATHRYPDETTITVTADGCGVLLRWDALQERRDEWRLCTNEEGLVEGDGLQYHEFFGQPDAEGVVCPTAPVVVPAIVASGPATEFHCTLAGDPWVVYWQVIGRETRIVGVGGAVDTVHVRQSVHDASEMGEQSTVDWYLDDNGLPIYVAATKRSKSTSPVGAVLYVENYTLSLESSTPAR
jgi:hypothetical protein